MPITKASGQAVAPAAKGDLVVGSATNDAAVLGVGSADQVLTVDSSTTTGLKWATPSAGSLTLLSTTSLTGTSVTISSISQAYTHLQIFVDNPYVNTAVGAQLIIKPNATNSLADYRFMTFTAGSSGNSGANATNINTQMELSNASAPTRNGYFIQINDYTNTTYMKTFNLIATSSVYSSIILQGGGIRTASAITSLQITTDDSTNTSFSGGQVRIYGVK